MKFDIVNKAVLWVGLGIVFIALSLYIFFTNLNLSKDFTGGIEIKINTQLSKDDVKLKLEDILKNEKVSNYQIMIDYIDNKYTDILIKTSVENDQLVNSLTKRIKESLIKNYLGNDESKILEFSVVGPSFGDYVRTITKKAIIWGLILMAIYILFAFIGIRKYISPLFLAIITILTMIFDISIPSGAYGILMHFNPTVQVDVVFVIAILTIMGYSINDTIVIFDRVREELQREKLVKGTSDFERRYAELFNRSLWLTMRRSLGTSFSTFLVVLTLYIFGTGAVKLFAFTMGVGIIAGTYSSIFFAAPLAYYLTRK